MMRELDSKANGTDETKLAVYPLKQEEELIEKSTLTVELKQRRTRPLPVIKSHTDSLLLEWRYTLLPQVVFTFNPMHKESHPTFNFNQGKSRLNLTYFHHTKYHFDIPFLPVNGQNIRNPKIKVAVLSASADLTLLNQFVHAANTWG